MNNAVFEMIYGKSENYRAKLDVKAGEIVQLGTRGAVACCDIAKGETGPVYLRGNFFFDCDPDYECDDTSPIAYDFKRKRFVPVGTNGALVIGAALFPTPKGSKFVGFALNA